MTDSIPESILKIGGILLAAGGSSRLGKPKQLLQFQGRSLIRIAADTLTNSLCRPIVVVLGAETDRSAYEVADLPVGVCANGEWQIGMGSSIRSGLQHLLGNEPDLDAVVIALSDQPLVTAADIDSLITEFITTTSPIVAARYGGIVGVPALFSKAVFGELLGLDGDKGARRIIRSRPDDVRTVTIETAAIDIDTPDDADRLNMA